MASDDIHTCSYSCHSPACIKAQRDELRDKLETIHATLNAVTRPKVCGSDIAEWTEQSWYLSLLTPEEIMKLVHLVEAHYGIE